MEELKDLSRTKNVYSTFRVKVTPKSVKKNVKSNINPIFGVILTPGWV